MDDPEPMSVAEREQFLDIVSEKIMSWAPMLSADAGVVPEYDESKSWTSDHALGDPLRWGIILMRAESHGPGSSTFLSLALPADPNR